MWSIVAGVLTLASLSAACAPSITTVSGTFAPQTVCSGELIFADEFDEFNLEKWQHENTLAGGGVSTEGLRRTSELLRQCHYVKTSFVRELRNISTTLFSIRQHVMLLSRF